MHSDQSPLDRNSPNRDIIVVGASAGGVEALQRLVRDLPADLPASVFIVLHVGSSSQLAALLDAAGPLPVAQAERGEHIKRGRIYVAKPGVHLLLHDDHILLRRGPRENLARPAIDPLFRSAACSFGARVIGVVLTGSLNDGTAGLRAIKRCGGIAIVQNPADAAVADMPASAMRHVDVDHCVPLAAMGGLLTRLTAERAGQTPEIPQDIKFEAAIAAQELSGMSIEDRLGDLAPFSCPECHGTLWEIADGNALRYRCHVGHAFTSDVMMDGQDAEGEQMLWCLLRSNQERAELARRVAAKERAHNQELAGRLDQRACEYDEDAKLVHQILMRLPATSG